MLLKNYCNFVPNGEIGEEGIRFVWKTINEIKMGTNGTHFLFA